MENGCEPYNGKDIPFILIENVISPKNEAHKLKNQNVSK